MADRKVNSILISSGIFQWQRIPLVPIKSHTPSIPKLRRGITKSATRLGVGDGSRRDLYRNMKKMKSRNR